MVFTPQLLDLEHITELGRRRSLVARQGIDFSSNDYLGLAASGILSEAARAALDRGVPVGSGGSRLLRGNHNEHEALEAEATAFFGSESTLYFSSGFAANSALIATLPQRGDLVIHDALIHASVHEGMRLTRAQTQTARHNDVSDVEDIIRKWRTQGHTGRIWIAVESLYSMDGDIAPLDDLTTLADSHDAVLMIDEAHATGALGEQGRGMAVQLEGRDNIITLRTLGKALGCEGALICAPNVVREFLINRARGFIFSTAPSPLSAAIARAALQIVRDGDSLRSDLTKRVAAAQYILETSGSHIIPVILGGEERTMAVAQHLQISGFDVRGIRPPTVPEGQCRLRISITNNVDMDDIHALGRAVKEAIA